VWEDGQGVWRLKGLTAVVCVVEMTAVLAVTMWWGAIRSLMPAGLVWVLKMSHVTVSFGTGCKNTPLYSRGKGKGKVHLRTGHKGSKGGVAV
jgi:hypothetical protein